MTLLVVSLLTRPLSMGLASLPFLLGLESGICVDPTTEVWIKQNPIEHLLDKLDRAIRKRMTTGSNLYDLEVPLLEEWEKISKDTTDGLTTSMGWICKTAIEAKDSQSVY
ncbi:hypothetical protein BDF14DRAFT_1360644 [Spinellus fusiger]|nr:hypothetical protein BDF14DRAFT_1360644 [Spinellus fusiger]